MSTQSTLLDSANISPPEETYERVTVTTSERFKLPSKFKGSFITISAEGTDIYARFGITSATTATTSVASSITSDLIEIATNGSWYIPAGQERDYDLSKMNVRKGGGTAGDEDIWLAHKSKATTGRLRLRKSSGPK